jgi:DNA repair protein RadC
VRSLSSTDLLALVIGSPSAAQTLVRRHGLPALAELPPNSWKQEPGIGRAKSVRLSAVFELGRRAYSTAAEASRPRLTRPREVFKEVRHIGALKKEHLVGLYLDAQNGLLHSETISVGSLNTTRTHPREILYPAIVHLAFGFILAHNHPSGSLDPSDEDVAFSRAVQRAGELVGIELYDHLIVTATGFTSLRERGAL